MPNIDNFSIGNYGLAGAGNKIDQIVSIISMNQGFSLSNGANGIAYTIAEIPAGTRLISLSALTSLSQLKVQWTSGSGVVSLALVDANGIAWLFISAGTGATVFSVINLQVTTSQSASFINKSGDWTPNSTSWLVGITSKPGTFDPDAGKMTLCYYITSNSAGTTTNGTAAATSMRLVTG
ncbi:hypothetical protein ACN9MH_15445 [Paenibacillus silvae]|uniref:hypothetical protein n=1 Tax=Paenibacillus silvae TaxID=1325358 RepID=UPI003CEA8930